MRITSKGQVTIPQEIRERAGLLPHTEVEFAIERGVVRIRRAVTQKKRSKLDAWAKRVSGTRRGGLSTSDIMKLSRGE